MAAEKYVVFAEPVDEAVYAQVVGSSECEFSVVSSRTPTPPEKIRILRDLLGIPQGLADCLGRAAEVSARRYWIVDNSGSMNTCDGNRVIDGGKLVSCTRWQELGDSLRWNGITAATLGVHTEFRLLNLTSSMRRQTVIINSENSTLDDLTEVIQSDPGGLTPLCATLNKLTADIMVLAPELRASGRSVSIIIASDGQASDGDQETLKAALAPLAQLPCDVIVRLCTDQDDVVEYWNEIDNDLELNLDVLDDTAGEGKEIRGFNPWIGYGEALHRVREFGAAPKVFDFLDERPFSISEAANAIKLILGDEVVRQFPHPEVDEDAYLRMLKQALSLLDPVFDASQKKVVPWIDVKVLATTVFKKSGVCIIS